MPEERKLKLSQSLQNTYKTMPKRTVMNDGIQNKYIPLTEVSTYESQGWKLGWLRKNSNNKRQK